MNTVGYALNPHEQELYDAVTEYVANGLSQAESNQNRNVGLALTILQRRLASSLFAITRSLERRRDRLALALEEARKSGRVNRPDATIRWDEEEDE